METKNEKQYIGVFGAAFLGIGAMVGAGIFALLGELAQSPAARSGSHS
jgi:amino acid transporter